MAKNKDKSEIITSIIAPEALSELERYSSLLSEILEKAERLLSLQSKLLPIDE